MHLDHDEYSHIHLRALPLSHAMAGDDLRDVWCSGLGEDSYRYRSAAGPDYDRAEEGVYEEEVAE